MGTTKDIKNEYLNNSLYVMSSRFEGFPMVLIEAASCGLMIVSFNCEHGPSEVIKEGVNGSLVKMGDMKLFEERVISLLNDQKKRIEFGENSSSISRQFNLQNIISEWDELFKRLLN